MALARLDNRIANAKAVMKDAQIALHGKVGTGLGLGSGVAALATYLQHASGVGTLIFLIATVAIGMSVTGFPRPCANA
jgi:hypothetical protein